MHRVRSEDEGRLQRCNVILFYKTRRIVQKKKNRLLHKIWNAVVPLSTPIPNATVATTTLAMP